MKSTFFVTALAYAMVGFTVASPMTELDSRQATTDPDPDVSHQFLVVSIAPNFGRQADFV